MFKCTCFTDIIQYLQLFSESSLYGVHVDFNTSIFLIELEKENIFSSLSAWMLQGMKKCYISKQHFINQNTCSLHATELNLP